MFSLSFGSKAKPTISPALEPLPSGERPNKKPRKARLGRLDQTPGMGQSSSRETAQRRKMIDAQPLGVPGFDVSWKNRFQACQGMRMQCGDKLAASNQRKGLKADGRDARLGSRKPDPKGAP